MLTRRLFASLAALLFAAPLYAADPGPAPEGAAAPYAPNLPAGSVKYDSAKYTQEIAVTNDRDRITPVPILDLSDARWHQPGGMAGVAGYKTERFRFVPEGKSVRTWVGNAGVKNSYGHVQQNRALNRLYPDGTRFDEVFTNADTGRVFEHRVREKRDGAWLSEVEFRDESARPKGYQGLAVSCSSCHAEAGTGKYAEGLVPGGDTVLGDPLPWKLWGGADPESRAPVLMKDRPRLVLHGVLHYEGPDGTYRPVPTPDVKADEPKKVAPAKKAEPKKAEPPKTMPVPVAPVPAAPKVGCASGSCAAAPQAFAGPAVRVIRFERRLFGRLFRCR